MQKRKYECFAQTLTDDPPTKVVNKKSQSESNLFMVLNLGRRPCSRNA